MARARIILLLAICSLVSFGADSKPAGRIIKVLPLLLDLDGKAALSPSLYERDAYQARLRHHPEQISAVRYDVQWKASRHSGKEFTLRLELRGTKSDPLKPMMIEGSAKAGWFSRWSSLRLTKEQYAELGEVLAWRATLWDGKTLVAEQQSFLWQ